MDFEKLFDRISLPEEGRRSFWNLHSRSEEKEFADSLSEAYAEYEKGDPQFGEYIETFSKRQGINPDVLTLYIYLRKSEQSIEVYREKGIDINIFYATMKDITDQCESNFRETGIYGIPQKIYRRWFRRHIGCEIFRLGRFNFQITESIYDAELEGIKISKGHPCISVHIPGGARLDEKECEASYEEAREFFKKYFDMENVVFFCYSWLLQPWISEVLPESSSIVSFQNKYKIIDFVDDPGDVLRWVYPVEYEIPNFKPEDYPENTSIQREVKKRILNGEIIGYGSGVRL